MKSLAKWFGGASSRPHNRNRRAESSALTIEQLEERVLFSVTPEEQLFVYELNRARHDPLAYEQEVDPQNILPNFEIIRGSQRNGL